MLGSLKNKKGFSFIDVIVALAITSVMAGGALTLGNQMFGTFYESRISAELVELEKNITNELRVKPYAQVFSQSETRGDYTISYVVTESGPKESDDVLSQIKNVNVKITKTGNRIKEFNTYRTHIKYLFTKYGNGEHGNVYISDNTNPLLNTYGKVISVNDDGKSISLANIKEGVYGNFKKGDTVLIHVSASVGTETQYHGNYIEARIASFDGSTIRLSGKSSVNDIIPYYEVPNYYVQAVTIPSFQEIVFSGKYNHPYPFNTSLGIGGIFALQAQVLDISYANLYVTGGIPYNAKPFGISNTNSLLTYKMTFGQTSEPGYNGTAYGGGIAYLKGKSIRESAAGFVNASGWTGSPDNITNYVYSAASIAGFYGGASGYNHDWVLYGDDAPGGQGGATGAQQYGGYGGTSGGRNDGPIGQPGGPPGYAGYKGSPGRCLTASGGGGGGSLYVQSNGFSGFNLTSHQAGGGGGWPGWYCAFGGWNNSSGAGGGGSGFLAFMSPDLTPGAYSNFYAFPVENPEVLIDYDF